MSRDPPEQTHLYTASGQFAGALYHQAERDYKELKVKNAAGQTVEVVATSRGYTPEDHEFWFRVSTGSTSSTEETNNIEYTAKMRRCVNLQVEHLIEKAFMEGTVMIPMKEWYNVLWIEWEGSIAYRRCCGKVLKRIWEAQELEAISLVLG